MTGFAFNNPQHTVSDPVYGLDNWIYLANEPAIPAVIFRDEFGDRGGDLRFPEDAPGKIFALRGRNLAFRPDTFELRFLSGTSQFGHTFDRWGRHFTVTNANHARHEVIAARYLERNPDLLVSSAMHSMSDHGNAARVFPLAEVRVEMLTEVGQFTSACGITIYEGGAFPSSYKNASFVAEPVHNLVHVDRLQDDGATFAAQRMREDADFLASSDSWFRPVFLYNGPDGALYVVDYYRESTEHPEWMAREAYENTELNLGTNLGRIYRVAPTRQPLQALDVNLVDAGAQELTGQLGNPNIWWRRTAQRLLVERRDPASLPLLVALAREGSSPLARLHALWSLEGLSWLEDELVTGALGDTEAGVRENAIRMAESRISNPEVLKALLGMGDDPDPKVRFQLLCTLGDVSSAEGLAVRERLLIGNLKDSWMQVAALSAPSLDAGDLFQSAVATLNESNVEGSEALFRQIGTMIGIRHQSQELSSFTGSLTEAGSPIPQTWRAAALEGLGNGLFRGGVKSLSAPGLSQDRLLRLMAHSDAGLRRAFLALITRVEPADSPGLDSTLEQSRKLLESPETDFELSLDSLQFISIVAPTRNEDLLKQFLGSQYPEALRATAAEGLGRIKGEASASYLIERWKTLTPEVRRRALRYLLRGRERILIFVAALEEELIQPSSLPFGFRLRLMMLGDEVLRERVRRVLLETPEEAEKKLATYRLALKGDAALGAEVFEKSCGKCHQLDDIGENAYGPDLATIRNKPRDALLRDILLPNDAIAQDYELHVIQIGNGEIVDGLVASRTPTAVTLRHEDGSETIIPRSRIREIRVADLSAMPEDLEQEISVEQMADLLEFLKRGT